MASPSCLSAVRWSTNTATFGREGRGALKRLSEIKRLRVPVLLTDDYGYNQGLWKIMSLDDDEKNVIDDGTPMVISFTLVLEEYAN
ncbi:phage tail protein [Vibrio fluvialis]|nr:phage tail protein [Vibrio fluvialis]